MSHLYEHLSLLPRKSVYYSPFDYVSANPLSFLHLYEPLHGLPSRHSLASSSNSVAPTKLESNLLRSLLDQVEGINDRGAVFDECYVIKAAC